MPKDPLEDRRHGCTINVLSGIDNTFLEAVLIGREHIYIFGDFYHNRRQYMEVPCPRSVLIDDQKEGKKMKFICSRKDRMAAQGS